jgi:hypothetical protein
MNRPTVCSFSKVYVQHWLICGSGLLLRYVSCTRGVRFLLLKIVIVNCKTWIFVWNKMNDRLQRFENKLLTVVVVSCINLLYFYVSRFNYRLLSSVVPEVKIDDFHVKNEPILCKFQSMVYRIYFRIQITENCIFLLFV